MMNSHRHRRRASGLLMGVALVFVLLSGRLYYLQVICHAHYVALQRRNSERLLTDPALRGPIVGAEGSLLALTRPAVTVCADLRAVGERERIVAVLARALDQDEARLRRLLRRDRRKWVELVRQADPRDVAPVRALDLPGLHFLPTHTRFYPYGRLLGHVVGLTDREGRGLEALELVHDSLLRGRPGLRQRQRDGRGRPLDPAAPARLPPVAGCQVVLTLDVTLQTFAADALDRIVRDSRPAGAVAIVVEPSTGRILALANRPDFDPNDRRKLVHGSLRNRALTDAFEPGSTLKPVIWAAVLDAGLVGPQERIFCEQGRWRIGSRVLHDSHPYGSLSLADGLVHSSNIMAAKLGTRLGAARLYGALVRAGFGRKSGLGLPGETPGLLRPPSRWTPVYSITSIPIGQEIQVTPLQLVMAYAALANGGRLLRPRIVERILDGQGRVVREETTSGRQAFSAGAARQVLAWLTEAVRRGTGRRAALAGYTVAGKTGTAQKAVPGQGYIAGKWVSSFVGIAPAESPRLVCLVLVDEPQGAHTGGQVAAPAVARILARSLRYLGVRPRPERPVSAQVSFSQPQALHEDRQ